MNIHKLVAFLYTNNETSEKKPCDDASRRACPVLIVIPYLL